MIYLRSDEVINPRVIVLYGGLSKFDVPFLSLLMSNNNALYQEMYQSSPSKHIGPVKKNILA